MLEFDYEFSRQRWRGHVHCALVGFGFGSGGGNVVGHLVMPGRNRRRIWVIKSFANHP